MKGFLLALLLLPAYTFAQKDRCKDIEQSTSSKGFVTYKSPDLKFTSVLKQFSDPQVFALHIYLRTDHELVEPTGVAIVFEDGTVVKDDDIKLTCMQEPSQLFANDVATTMTHAGNYILQVYFPISRENVDTFSTKAIKQVTLKDVPQKVSSKEAEKIRDYIKCMDALDK